MESDQFIKPERVSDGDYLVSFHSARKGPPRYGRQDLILFFSMKDRENALLPAYFQVKWQEDGSFKAGPKSNYYRSYQACFGLAPGDTFSVDDFKGKEVMAKVVTVTKDADNDDLDILNQYSRIKKMWVEKDSTSDRLVCDQL